MVIRFMTPRLLSLASLSACTAAGGMCMYSQASFASDSPLHRQRVSAPLPRSNTPPAHVRARQARSANSKPLTVFVNFDGANLLGGSYDDSSQNTTQIIELSGQYPPYAGSDLERTIVIESVREDWKDFNVEIVSERPSSGEYIMCMVGEKDHSFGQGVLGIAPLDCNNANPSSVVFSFIGKPYSSDFEATIISQEVAHALGLEHVYNEDDIMNAYAGGSFNPTFVNECTSIDGDNYCVQQHSLQCENGQQNSHAELLNMFGAPVEGDDPPTVNIDSPTDGQRFDADSSIEVYVRAEDDVEVTGVELMIDGASLDQRVTAPYQWTISEMEDGTHELTARAFDSVGQSTMSSTVTITVGSNGQDSGDLTTSGGEPTGPNSSGEDEEGNQESEGDTSPDSGNSEEDEGGLIPRRPKNISQENDGCTVSRSNLSEQTWLLWVILGGIAMAPTRRFGHTRARD